MGSSKPSPADELAARPPSNNRRTQPWHERVEDQAELEKYRRYYVEGKFSHLHARAVAAHIRETLSIDVSIDTITKWLRFAHEQE